MSTDRDPNHTFTPREPGSGVCGICHPKESVSLCTSHEPCPKCGCPGEQYDGHACEDFAANHSLFDSTQKAWAALRELQERLSVTPNAPDVRLELTETRDALNRLDGAILRD